MQNCVTNSFTPLSLLECRWKELNQHCMPCALNKPRGSPLMLLLSAKTTSAIFAHSPVLLTGNVLNSFPDCWPSEVRHAFIVTESKWIPRKFNCCRGWRLLFFQFTVESKGCKWASTFTVSITPWFRVGMQINQSSRYGRILIPCNWRGAKAWDHSSNTFVVSFWMRVPLSIGWDSWG